MVGLTLDTLKIIINKAFADVRYPGDDKIAIKQWYLTDEDLDGYVGRQRENVTVDFINDGHRVCTTFMTNEAFHYYLPVFLILCAEYAYEMDVFSERIIGRLTPRVQDDYLKLVDCLEELGLTLENAGIFPSNEEELEGAQCKFLSLIQCLTKPQREAVYLFLVYYEHKYQDRNARNALSRFWSDFKDHNWKIK